MVEEVVLAEDPPEVEVDATAEPKQGPVRAPLWSQDHRGHWQGEAPEDAQHRKGAEEAAKTRCTSMRSTRGEDQHRTAKREPKYWQPNAFSDASIPPMSRSEPSSDHRS